MPNVLMQALIYPKRKIYQMGYELHGHLTNKYHVLQIINNDVIQELF